MTLLIRLIVAAIAAPGLVQAAPLIRASESSAVSQWVKRSGQSIKWGPCSDQFPDTLTCATLRVPLDWDHAQNNETIELGMIRREADDTANRIGYLFVNPGGPGGQATGTVSRIGSRAEPEILARFDVIGLDPRGVGLSTPVQCDAELFNKRVVFRPKTQDAYDALVKYNKDLGESCVKGTGRLLNYVDTISAVKDHEAVRVALGEKASFLGLSYGTQLFGQYAELFPDSFRAIVLDGNLQHSQTESTNLLVEATTSEATFKQFLAWCASADECVLREEDVASVFTSVVDKASATPIPAPGCDDVSCRSEVNDEDLLFVLQGFLAGQSNWPTLAQALREADGGNATIISEFVGLAIGSAYEDSGLYAGTAIGCQDWAHESTGLADLLAKQELGAVFSPLTRGATQSYKLQTTCIGWPAPLSNPPAPIRYQGEDKILMVNSLYDPETSYTWALGLQSEIKNAVLLTRNGSGHTSYFTGGETTKLTNAYLLNLTLPEPGTITQS